MYTTDTHAIPTGIKGPLKINNQVVGGVILGRSSATLRGLRVEPGVIDPDSEGEIFILAHTDFPPLSIPKGEKIAQLVPIPRVPPDPGTLHTLPQRRGQFGSTGSIIMLSLDLSERPKRHCTLSWQNHSLSLTRALLDTGADSCIMDPSLYPKTWPTVPNTGTIAGIGGVRVARQTPVLIVTLEGKRAPAAFSLTPLPEQVDCILGRDVLAQLGFKLTDSPLA